MATVSVCVAVYNGEAHLAKALDSILAQSVKPDEVLVLDDGSTDGSVAVASAYPSVRVIRQANGGIGAARRRLVEEAAHEWIAFCDHDDWWEKDRLEAELPFTSDPGVSLIYCGAWHVDDHGLETEVFLHAEPDAPSIDHVSPSPEDWTSSVLLRRSAVLEAGNFNDECRTGEDILMWFKLGGIGRIVRATRPLVHILRREGSASAPDRRQFECRVRLFEEEILPNFDRWYGQVPQAKRDACRRQIEERTGYAMAILATYVDRDGDRESAMGLYRRALKLSPRSKGVWYRYLRGVLRIPVLP